MEEEIKKYPYFVYPIIAELSDCKDPGRLRELRQLIAANVGDPDALRALTGKSGIDFRSFYPDSSTPLSTEATIDSFLARFGGGTAPIFDSGLFDDDIPSRPHAAPEETRSSQPVPEPTPEEVSFSTPEPEEVPEEVTLSLQASEVATEEVTTSQTEPEVALGEACTSTPEVEEAPEECTEEVPISRTEPEPAPENPLEKIKILVKNKDYKQALEIMEAFYLNNPKKSVYFADQIRFIKKMMINERKK